LYECKKKDLFELKDNNPNKGDKKCFSKNKNKNKNKIVKYTVQL